MNNDIKINSKISNYIFNKNKFSLSKQSNIIENKNLNYCKKYSIKNNKAGFNFYGKNNICKLYSNHKPSNKINNNIINNYSIRKFIKNKKQKNASLNDQSNNNYYFNELNHFNLHSTDLIKKTNVQNLDSCMNDCLNTPSCNSITYFQEPYKCTFYNDINLSNNKNNKYDSYTINKNQNYNLNDINDEEDITNQKTDIHNIDYLNNSYTNCFTKENHNNYKKLVNSYDNICKNQFGEGYIFSNKMDNKNVLECDTNKIRISCMPTFMENFENKVTNKSKKQDLNMIIYTLILLILIIILYILLKK